MYISRVLGLCTQALVTKPINGSGRPLDVNDLPLPGGRLH